MLKNVINKLKARREYFKNIKNRTDIPVLWTTINITKPNTNKNCTS